MFRMEYYNPSFQRRMFSQIVYKKNNKVIGSLGLHNSWANKEADYAHLKLKEIGYVLSKPIGNGLMPEAVNAVIKFCFERCGLEALTVSHFSFNNQSKRSNRKMRFFICKQGEYYAEQLQKTFEDMKYILFR